MGKLRLSIVHSVGQNPIEGIELQRAVFLDHAFQPCDPLPWAWAVLPPAYCGSAAVLGVVNGEKRKNNDGG